MLAGLPRQGHCPAAALQAGAALHRRKQAVLGSALIAHVRVPWQFGVRYVAKDDIDTSVPICYTQLSVTWRVKDTRIGLFCQLAP